MFLVVLAFLVGQNPTMFDLPATRSAFIKACKPHMEPWTEMGTDVGAGSAVFLVRDKTPKHLVKSATFDITTFSVKSRPESYEMKCLFGYARAAYGEEVEQWVRAQASLLLQTGGTAARLDRGILYVVKFGLGRHQRQGGCGSLQFNVYQF